MSQEASARKWVRNLLSCTLLCASPCLHAQLRLGQKFPMMHLGPVLAGDPAVPVAGHAMLIELWATWCAPCREQIPHLNALATQFRGRGIDFLAMTCESPKTVREFLKKNPIEGTVAIDPDCAVADAVDAPGYPTTLLVDSKRRLAAVTRPSAIKGSVIEELLAGSDLPLSAQTIDTRLGYSHNLLINEPPQSERDADARIVVRRAEALGSSVCSPDQFESTGSSLPDLLSFAFDVPSVRIETPAGLSTEIYSVQAWVPREHPEALKPLIQAALSATAGIDARFERRQVEVLALTGMPGKLSPVSVGGNSCQTMNGEITLQRCSADSVRSALEYALGKIIVLDNPPDGAFSVTLHWSQSKPEELITLLREKYGLELNPQSRPMDFLIVSRSDAAKRLAKAQ